MKLCFSVYANILKAFKRPSATQIQLGRALLGSLDGSSYELYSDAQISDLFHGKKGIGNCDLEAARDCDVTEYLARFKHDVIPLLNPNEIASIVAAMKDVLRSDCSIKDATVIDLVLCHSKEAVLSSFVFDAVRFLAGLYLYTLLNTENRGTVSSAKEVNDAFLEASRAESVEIQLLDYDDNETRVCEVLWRCGPNSLSVVAGDIFSYPFADSDKALHLVVIPVDVSFSTKLASGIEGMDPFCVSEKTLHGMFLKHLMSFTEDVANLDQRIQAELREGGFCKDSRGCYPIGSTAVIDVAGDAMYCLLAIAEHDAHGNTHSKAKDIEDAINKLSIFYDQRGQGYPMLVPLVGTGRSRSGLTPQESFELLVACFTKDKGCIQGEIDIVVLPEIFEELDIEKARIENGL